MNTLSKDLTTVQLTFVETEELAGDRQQRKTLMSAYCCWLQPFVHIRSKNVMNTVYKNTFWAIPFVKRFALCYWTVVCLSVTLVYCGQTAGWIKMSLGSEVGLGPGDIMLDGDPAAPTKRGTAAPPPLFDPCIL